MSGSDSPGQTPHDTGHSTPSSAPDTPPSQYRTATATLSAAFASLWGSYQQQEHKAPQSEASLPSAVARSDRHASEAPSGTAPSTSSSSGWGSLLSRGSSAANHSVVSPSSPSRAPTRHRSRAAIPFNISAPLEAQAGGAARDLPVPTSPRTSSLRSVFQPGGDHASNANTLQLTIDTQIASEASVQQLESGYPDSPPALFADASSRTAGASVASAAYATLSRLRGRPARSGLRSGSGFLWGSGGPSNTAQTQTTALSWEEALQKQERLDTHVRRIIFQAGLDYETRPMVVLAACCLPDPNEVEYDDLFDRIISTMDLFAENDYTIVYLASGGRHRPGFNWLWKSYRRLSRKFRKNLKKLYIVHPTWFTKSLMQFIQTGAYVVSPKFPKKVTILNTLSELAQHVPLTQIDIPPEVLQVNAAFEPSVTLPPAANGRSEDSDNSRVFGVELVQLMGEHGEKGGVPKVVRDCVEAILGTMGDTRPIEVEGIFRRSPSSALLKAAQESYDRGHPVNLSNNYTDPHVPAVLLKVFLRSLPRPIFSANLYSAINACPPPPPSSIDVKGDAKMHQAAAQETIQYLREVLLPAVEPPSAVILLSYVLGMLHRVSQHSDLNKMDAANLATVIAPNLVSSGNAMRDVMLCKVEGIRSMADDAAPAGSQSPSQKGTTTLGSIVRFCIERYYEIFDEAEFGPRLEAAQQLVDEISALPTSASIMTFHSADEGSPVAVSSSPTSPRILREGLPTLGGPFHHHRNGSTSSASVVSQPNSPFQLSFTPSRAKASPALAQTDFDAPSVHTGKSMTSREVRAAGLGTIGRNSFASLRLTKRALRSPSSTNARGSPREEELTGSLSGVALTGASAAGYFSSPAPVNRRSRPGSDGSGGCETPSTPISLSPKGSPTTCTSSVAASSNLAGSDGGPGDGVPSRSVDSRSTRRELSLVQEDGEQKAPTLTTARR